MSITHIKQQPKNIHYWDYYILCRLDLNAAIALQRMEYWDSTKEGGNVHAEALNDALKSVGKASTQDTSRWIYKSQDELRWEMMGVCGEKAVTHVLDALINDLHYLQVRSNPDVPFDQKKQYLYCEEPIKQHLDYLAYILDFFQKRSLRMTPIYYAIELLTRGGVFIEELNVTDVIRQVEQILMQIDFDEREENVKNKKYKPIHPVFLRNPLKKDRKRFALLLKNEGTPFRNFAEWKAQNCGMEDAILRNATSEIAECTPQECGSNSNNYNQSLQPVTTPEERENIHTHADALPESVADASAFRNEPIPLFSSDTLVQIEQHADVPIVTATDETDVPVGVATGNATPQPTRSRRRPSSKKRVDLDAIPLQERPPRPEREMPWSPRKLLLWGDYFRGYRLQESNQKNSYYQRAQQAAVNIVGRKITEANYVAIHRFMLGVKVTLEDDPTFRDDWWPENKVADVWNVEQHATEMARKIKAKKSHLHPVASPPQPEQTQPIELGGYRTFIPDDDDEVQYVTRRNSPTKLVGGTR